MAQDSTQRDLGAAIGRAVAKYRVSAGLTQAQVAEMLDVSIDAVSRMERGGIMPTVARLIRLAEIFGCEAADMLTEASPLANDQARYLADLLGKLNEESRAELVAVIERMAAWYLRGGKERTDGKAA